jgi:hypothetical protein
MHTSRLDAGPGLRGLSGTAWVLLASAIGLVVRALLVLVLWLR